MDANNSDGGSSPLSSVPESVEEQKDAQVVERSRRTARKRSTRAEPPDAPDDLEELHLPKAPKRKILPVRGDWSTDHLLQNPKSKLTSVNLVALLNHERAWTELSRDEQETLISMLPSAEVPPIAEDGPLPNVLSQLMKYNSSFQADVRLFQEDLSAGRYDPVWLKDAQTAMEKRAKGDFDDWKERHREEFWGQKQKIQWNALAGDSSQHSLQTLVAAGYFEVGDTWILRRAHRKPGGTAKDQIVVEKEAKISSISSDHTLAFTFPPGQHKFSAPANGPDISIEGVDGPIRLSDSILQEDGRVVGIRGANSWREFRCIRKNQDMGGLFDIRELYHHRQST